MMTCKASACESAPVARGYCNKHYLRFLKFGTPDGGGRRYQSADDAMAAKTERQGDCTVWTGALAEGGYARLRAGGRKVYAHVYAWEKVHGPKPDGMDLDHTCHNRACVNVEHLRVATREQNARNRAGTNGNAAGARNVYRLPSGSYRVVVGTPPRRITKTYQTFGEAVEAAAMIRSQVFGEYAGRG